VTVHVIILDTNRIKEKMEPRKDGREDKKGGKKERKLKKMTDSSHGAIKGALHL
jgi:hypothetical protein